MHPTAQIGIQVLEGAGGVALGAWTLARIFSKEEWDQKALAFIGTIAAEMLLRHSLRDITPLLGRIKELKPAYIVPGVVLGSAALFISRYVESPSRAKMAVSGVLSFGVLVAANFMSMATIRHAFPPLSRIGHISWSGFLKAGIGLPIAMGAMHLSSAGVADIVQSSWESEMRYNNLLALLPSMFLVVMGRESFIRLGKQAIRSLAPTKVSLIW